MKQRITALADRFTKASARHRIYMWYCTGAAAFLLASSPVSLVRGQILPFVVGLLVGLMFIAMSLFHRMIYRGSLEQEGLDNDQ